MTAFVWLLLAVCGIPVSAYRPESGLLEYPLQAETAATATQDSPEKDAFALRCLNARGRTERNDEDEEEEKALQLLANLWNYTKVNIRGNIAECKKGKKRKAQRLGEGFDVTCQDGRIATLGLKKPAPVKISELEKAICRLPKLRELVLDGSNVTGSLEEVKGWTHLERIHMRFCKVGGDLKHLRDLKELKFLKLSGRNIQGSLHDLDQDFEILDLGHTSVTGDLSEMSSKTSKSSRKGFRGLWLQNTSVSGDIMDILKKNLRLQFLHLSSTKVSGALCNPEQEEGKNLTELDLSNSLVTICNSSWKEIGEHAPFPYLTKLDVTGCNLAMDVWDFLSPLAKTCYHLVELRVANCNLSGELEDMTSFNNMPLYWKPAVVDLSGNNITALRGMPRECMLDVRNNPLEVIDPPYFKTPLLLDIRETPYKLSALESQGQAPGDLFENIKEPTLTSHIHYSCKGVKPKDTFRSYDILVSPQTFAPNELCQCAEGFAGIGTNCTQCLNRTEPIDLNSTNRTERIETCCGCKPGKAYIEEKMENVSRGCYKCHGRGCNVSRCNRSCAPGYNGTLCSYCEEGYHTMNTTNCEECPFDLAVWPLAVAAASCPMVLALAIWFWVFRPTTHDLLQETPWDRKGEFVEQALMFLSYIQVLRVLQNTVMVNVGVAFKFPSQLKIGDLLRALSLECHLGYSVGKTVESLSSSFFLPLLCLVGLLAGFFRGSCFWGLKFVLLMISLLFVGTVQSTVTNAKCIYTDKDGLDLGTSAYFPEFPDHQCHESSALQVGLTGAILLNGIMIPGSLLLLGWFVSRPTTGVYTSLRNLRPICICEQADDGVLLRIHTRKMKELGAAMEESLQMSAFYIHAAVFSVYIGQAIGSEKLQISQINSDDSMDLNVKVLAAEPSESDLAVAKAQSRATWLSDTLAHRHASKAALLDYDEALWVGGWTLFKRYSLREVFWCEGFSKGCLFIVTALCTSKSTLPLAGILLLGLGLATANGSPFSSTSRNQMGSVFTICLGITCFTACMEQTTQTTISICVLVTVAGVLPCLFWIHCQLMEADEVFQVHHLLAKLDKLGKGTTPTAEDILEPITWDFEERSAVGRLLATYRHVVKRIKQTASRLMFFQ